MKEKLIQGKYNTAKAFLVDDEKIAIDQNSENQIKQICDNPIFKDSRIRIMPDVHAGKIGPIGISIDFNNECTIPNLIGNDIGCGIESWEIFPKRKLTKSDFEELDKVIRSEINIYHSRGQVIPSSIMKKLLSLNATISIDRVLESFNTLGGGNHFIEVDKFEDRYLLTIHSGSRSLGNYINSFYNLKGQEILKDRNEIIPYEFTYIEGDLFHKYLDDIDIVNFFAHQNRLKMVDTICKKMKWSYLYFGGSVHNTIYDNDFSNGYKYSLYKGACHSLSNVSIIPVNMKDGIIITETNSNPDWNFSLPHGSGRLVMRSDAKNVSTVSDFKKEMKGIYSSCINSDTLDESPIMYRRIEPILNTIKESVKILGIGTPLFSFKGGGKE